MKEPYQYWDDYCEKQEEKAAKYHDCSECGDALMDGGYHIMGKWFCPECIRNFYVDDCEVWNE